MIKDERTKPVADHLQVRLITEGRGGSTRDGDRVTPVLVAYASKEGIDG
jgi:hypothetical protein